MRVFWGRAQVRAVDLRAGDVALLGRHELRWREVLDVYGEDCDPNEAYARNTGEWITLTKKVVEGCGHVGVRVLADENSTQDDVHDRLLILRTVDLVEIQVPAGAVNG
jgi:hypothetical protein